MTSTLRIHLLGEFCLFVDGQPHNTLPRPRQQALMAYLLLHRHAPQSRQQIAFSFWPDSPERQAFTNLRRLVFDLRQVLPQVDDFLIADTLSLSWRNDAAFTLDVAEVEQALQQLEETDAPDAAAVTRVLTLYRGELLPTCYDDWLLPIRRGLHERVVNTLTQALTDLITQHEYQVGLRAADHLLRLDPLHEAAYRHLMHLRALSGDRAGAIRVYHECVTMLEQELGVAPATETQTLYQQLLKAEPQALPEPMPTMVQRHEHVPLVGRKQEWQVLQQAWQQMSSRGPHLMTIWGEAGAGKTRLAEDLMHWARLRPGTVAYARSYEVEGALSYAPLTEWLRSEVYHKPLRQLADTWRTELARLLPELLSEQPALPSPLPMSEGWQRQRFYEALARAVLSGPQPVLLVIDDLQWCDAETLAWLRYLLRFDVQAPLLVVGTVRSAAVDPAHALHTLRPSLQRENQWTEMELTPLSAHETTVLAGYLTDEDVTQWQARLYQETEGNPLFVVEMVQAGLLTSQNHEQAEHVVALPGRVQAVITTRLSQLSPQARQLTEVAATIGRAFGVEVLAAASELDEDALVQSIDELWQRRIVREQRDGYDFSHDKIREVAYSQIAPMRRRLLHRKVAETLEWVHREQLDEVSGVLAEHHEQAGNAKQAAAYFMRAAESATFTSYTAAVEYFSRALALTPTTEHTARARILLRRGMLYLPLGQPHQSRDDLDAVLHELRHVEDSPHKTTLLAETSLAISDVERRAGHYGMAASHAQEALVLAQRESGHHNLIADAYYHWGSAFWHQGKMTDAQAQFTQALHWAREAGNETIEAKVLNYLAATGMFSGMPGSEILEYMYASLPIQERVGDLRGLADSYMKLGYVLMTQGTGQYEQAFEYHRKSLALSVEIGDRGMQASLLRSFGTLNTVVGDYPEALTQLMQSLALSQALDEKFGEGIVLNLLGYLRYNMGDLEQARSLHEASLRLLDSIGSRQRMGKSWSALSQIHHALGDDMLAVEYANRSVELAREMGETREEAQALTCLGYAQIGLGGLVDARAAFERAYHLRHNLGQTNRSLEPLAGLAQLALVACDMPQMRQGIEPIFAHICRQEMDCTEDTFQVYLVCYRVLAALGDPRAVEALRIAHEHLTQRAASLDAAEACIYWSVPGHGEIARAYASELEQKPVRQ